MAPPPSASHAEEQNKRKVSKTSPYSINLGPIRVPEANSLLGPTDDRSAIFCPVNLNLRSLIPYERASGVPQFRTMEKISVARKVGQIVALGDHRSAHPTLSLAAIWKEPRSLRTNTLTDGSRQPYERGTLENVPRLSRYAVQVRRTQQDTLHNLDLQAGPAGAKLRMRTRS